MGLAIFGLGGFVQGCTGFGMALVAAPCLMLFMPPTAAVPTVIILSLVNTSVVAFEARRHIRLGLVGPLAAGGVIGVQLGIWALEAIHAPTLTLFVGAFVTLFAMALLAGWRRPLRDPKWALVPVGMAGGILGGSTSMGGPPLILFLANQDTPKDAFRGNIVLYFFITNCIAIATLAAKGLLDWSVGERSLVCLPGMLLGTFAGVKLARRVPEELFRKIVMSGVGIMGLVLLARSVLHG